MKILTLGIAAALLAGCNTSPNVAEHREVYVKPAMILLTADQAAARGLNVTSGTTAEPPLPADLQPTDTRAVIAPPSIKVYTVNRSSDPADRDLLHEQHVVYRRETTPTWRMQPPTDQKILVGPRVTDGREDLQPVLSKELVSYLTEQRQATEANQKAIAALFQAIERLGSTAGHPASEDANTNPAAHESSEHRMDDSVK
jgi:hypothetical protein